jgi:hypothetical protein
MTIHINNELMLRLLDIQEFFANQWMGAFSNDYKKISEQLKNIKKQQLSLRELSKEDKDGEGSSGGGGRGTIKGLRAKDDPNKRNPFSTRMSRK